MARRADLIRELADGLPPAPRLLGPLRLALLFGAAMWLFVLVATIAVQPLRPGVLDQLLTSPRFAAETGFGLLASSFALWVSFALGTPGRLRRPAIAVALGGLFLWAGVYVYGLVSPALGPSMMGKRALCFLEVVLYGLPTLGVGLVLLRRRAPLERWSAGLVLGAACGSVPGLLMQLACMYLPPHILSHHLGPALGLALLGALAGPLAMRRI